MKKQMEKFALASIKTLSKSQVKGAEKGKCIWWGYEPEMPSKLKIKQEQLHKK